MTLAVMRSSRKVMSRSLDLFGLVAGLAFLVAAVSPLLG